LPCILLIIFEFASIMIRAADAHPYFESENLLLLKSNGILDSLIMTNCNRGTYTIILCASLNIENIE